MSTYGELSAIILMRNKVSMSRLCLEALARSLAEIRHEVIVIDNASTEDLGPIRDCQSLFQNFRIVRVCENSTFSSLNNWGAGETSGQWLLFLNNDVFLSPTALTELLSSLIEDRRIGITGGRLLFPGETRVQHAGICQMLWGYPSNYGVGAEANDPRLMSSCDRFALTGALLCLPREVFQSVGGFDERYSWGVEDVDLCLKINAAGLRVWYNHEALGVHVESATLKGTQKTDISNNYRVFRSLWQKTLVSREQAYVQDLKTRGVRRIVVFGTGLAARGLTDILNGSGIEIEAFTSSQIHDEGYSFLGRPVVPITALKQRSFDRLLVASQFFFEVEPMLLDYDPIREPLFPVLI